VIITLTPNPAVDQTIWVDRPSAGEVNRFARSQLDPAGKGINVSRVAHRLGWPTIAFGFLGGEVGLLAEHALDREGVQHGFIRVEGQTRLNLTVVDEASGQATSFYGAGSPVSVVAQRELEATLLFWLQSGRVLVLAGSLPPGMPDDTYARYVRLARTSGVRVILDADGDALRLGVEAKPFAIKPNSRELERLVGRKLDSIDDVALAALEVNRGGVEVVLVTMGSRGAICVRDEQVWRVHPPAVERRSTVGSGDSFVAGFAVALARGQPLEDALRLASAAGAATALAPGTGLAAAETVRALVTQVRVETDARLGTSIPR
jgi:1-phosphofructokinase